MGARVGKLPEGAGVEQYKHRHDWLAHAIEMLKLDSDHGSVQRRQETFFLGQCWCFIGNSDLALNQACYPI